jgi:hypothetical protein
MPSGRKNTAALDIAFKRVENGGKIRSWFRTEKEYRPAQGCVKASGLLYTL